MSTATRTSYACICGARTDRYHDASAFDMPPPPVLRCWDCGEETMKPYKVEHGVKR